MKSYLTSDKQNHYKPAAEAENNVAKNTSSQEVAQLKAFQKMADQSEQVQQGKQFNQMANQNSQQPVQQKEQNTEDKTQGKTENTSSSSGLPTQLKSGIEGLSGYSMDDVKVHYNSSKPAQLQAHAYAQGTDIHVAPGQEKHLAHEAWHVVQQKQGRVQPTTQLKGKNLNDDASLEKEADVMGEKAKNESNKEGHNIKQESSKKSNIIQGYFVGAANRSVSNTISLGQDRQADNSFRDPNDLEHEALVTSGSDPTQANSLKISEDGKLAIENTGDNRQAKVFYAESKIIAKSNKILLKKGSKYILHVKQANAIDVTSDNGKVRTLDAIEPIENPDKGKKSKMKNVAPKLGGQLHGNNITVDATCIAVAEAIMNKKYGNGGAAKLNVNLKKLGALTPTDEIQWAAIVGDAITKNGKRKSGTINEDAIAEAYGVFVNQNPRAAMKMAKKLGVNEYAMPKVGESYISESMGNPGANGGITNWLLDSTGNTDTELKVDDANVRGGKRRVGWGNHVGAVVATSGGNNITLENYARDGEDGSLTSNDNIFYFEMYGPPSNPTQTWHAVWSGGAAPIANAVTAVLR